MVLREIAWLNDNKDHSICVICQYMDSEMEQSLKHLGASYVIIDDWKYNNVYSTILQEKECDEDVIQFLGFEEFICFQLKNTGCAFRAYLYCVNPIDFHLGQKIKCLKPILKPLISSTILGYSKSKEIVYLDKMTLESNIQYYGVNYKKCRWTFIPLPYKPSYKKNKVMTEKNLKILAVARASFPFKGYLLGLIDTISEHYHEMPDCKVTVISTGDDIDQLKEKIHAVNRNVDNRITLIEGVRADRLYEYYTQSNLFIGMGTTILEAAECGTPAIVAHPYINRFLSEGFFHENTNSLGGNNENLKDGWEDIYKYINFSVEKREEISQETLNKLTYYDADVVLEKLDTLDYSTKFIMNPLSKCILKFYFFVKSKLLS